MGLPRKAVTAKNTPSMHDTTEYKAHNVKRAIISPGPPSVVRRPKGQDSEIK